MTTTLQPGWTHAAPLSRRRRITVRARWERPAFFSLLAATAVIYLWNLSASGWANSFYSAAVQAGSVSWKAFLFGSSDAANSITVDKPPASLWPMELAVRLFGLNSWSILVPEALMGVATVAVVYRLVRRYFSAGAALLAGATLALTPVAALMFKFNNPDALLVLLLTVAVSLTLRAVETGRARPLVWAGVAIGFGFLTKQLQAFLVLPALAGTYLIGSPRSLPRRIRDLLAAGLAVIASAGWWVAIVELTPASMRPYIGGSQHNSFLELTFGYNGLGRLTGSETGSVVPGGGAGGAAGGPGGGSMWGPTGLFRLFENEVGGQISWLIPAALILGAVGLWLLRRAPRTNIRRATLLAFGGVLVTTLLAFSFMAGIFHAYYTVALAPSVAVVFAVGAEAVWQNRDVLWARIAAVTAIVVTSAWAWVLLDWASNWAPDLKCAVVALGFAAALLWLWPRLLGWAAVSALAVSVSATLLAPAAYTLDTISQGHQGAIVTAGPAVASVAGPGGGAARGAFPQPPGGTSLKGGQFPGAAQGGGIPVSPQGGQVPGAGTGATPRPSSSTAPNGFAGGTPGGSNVSPQGGAGGLLDSGRVSKQLAKLLEADYSKYTWVAAAVGSNTAAGYQLATQEPVMPIGGFNGSDPSPTLRQFEADVAAGKIHYFIGGGGLGQANGGSNVASQITTWVQAHYTAKTVDGVTLYDLSAG